MSPGYHLILGQKVKSQDQRVTKYKNMFQLKAIDWPASSFYSVVSLRKRAMMSTWHMTACHIIRHNKTHIDSSFILHANIIIYNLIACKRCVFYIILNFTNYYG